MEKKSIFDSFVFFAYILAYTYAYAYSYTLICNPLYSLQLTWILAYPFEGFINES